MFHLAISICARVLQVAAQRASACSLAMLAETQKRLRAMEEQVLRA